MQGTETVVLADAGYQGVEKRIKNQGRAVQWHVAMKRMLRKALPATKIGRMRERLEVLKASVRAKVEHPFHVIKNLSRHRNTRYRGLAKNMAQPFTLFAFANLVLAGRRLGSLNPEVRPERRKACKTGPSRPQNVHFRALVGPVRECAEFRRRKIISERDIVH